MSMVPKNIGFLDLPTKNLHFYDIKVLKVQQPKYTYYLFKMQTK